MLHIHLGAHHSPDLFHVQHALSKAVSAPMAAKQRAADKGRHQGARDAQAGARATPDNARRRRLQSAARAAPRRRQLRLEQVGAGRGSWLATSTSASAGSARRSPRASAPSATPTTCVDLERGVRRNGKLIAGDIQAPHRHDPHHCPARRPQRGVPGSDRESRARGAQNAGNHRVRLDVMCGSR